MITNNIHKEVRNCEGGFALLLTIIVISVTLAIGLSLLNITLKQFTLSVSVRESEKAFHAANVGHDCARIARMSYDTDAPGAALPFSCAEESSTVSPTALDGGKTRRYTEQFSWAEGGEAYCTEVELFVLDATSRGSGYTHTFTNRGIESSTCPRGTVCTVVFARGYNRGCGNLSGLNVVQRELTSEY